MIGYLNGRRERFLQSGEWNGIVLSAAVINWAAAEKGVSRANDRQSRGFVAGQREIELREDEKRNRERDGGGAIKLRR